MLIIMEDYHFGKGCGVLAVTIGIPRGLLYYYYGNVWKEFLELLGAEVIISQPTTKEKLLCGSVADEVCLPVKVFLGHANELSREVDYLFVPRVVSVAKNQYTCPKMMGLPDMLRTITPCPIIDVCINLYRSQYSLYTGIMSIAKYLRANRLTALQAWRQACSNSHVEGRNILSFRTNQPTVIVIGHPYLLFDSYLSMDIIDKLEKFKVNVITAESISTDLKTLAAGNLEKRLYWSYCEQLVGAVLELTTAKSPVNGIIFVTSFSCGPDSLTSEIVKHHAHQQGIPCMLLAIDEHTAEAGLITRLEAFVDMIARRWKRCV